MDRICRDWTQVASKQMLTSTEQSPGDLTPAPVRRVPVSRPFRWLALGWRDFKAAGLPSAMHGVAVALGGWVIVLFLMNYWYLLPGAFTGFLLVGPILATGLYEISRRRLLGERPTLEHVIGAWRKGTRPLVWLGLLLVLAGTLWVLVSAIVFAIYSKTSLITLESFLRDIVLNRQSHLFDVWLLLGGVGAALVFAATAVSAPLLLDRDVDMLSAIITSVRAVGENPVAMALWAAIIMVVTVVSMAALMLGFLLAIPVVGHGTWHAYRDLVDAEGLPPRQ